MYIYTRMYIYIYSHKSLNHPPLQVELGDAYPLNVYNGTFIALSNQISQSTPFRKLSCLSRHLTTPLRVRAHTSLRVHTTAVCFVCVPFCEVRALARVVKRTSCSAGFLFFNVSATPVLHDSIQGQHDPSHDCHKYPSVEWDRGYGFWATLLH